MNHIDHFRQCLLKTIQSNTLHENQWKNDSWKSVWPKINQVVLNDAFKQHDLIRSLFSDLGELIPRNCKSFSRVEQKMKEQFSGKENYFKVVSDLVAVRIHCPVNEIASKIDRIREIVLANKGTMHIRGSSKDRPYGFFMNADKKYIDITQYVYVFIEKVGYPVEVQIGHEFASHTFTIDSALRDNPKCGKVDLWSKNFYSDVKNYILSKANGLKPGSIASLQNKAEELHQNKIPKELQGILNKL